MKKMLNTFLKFADLLRKRKYSQPIYSEKNFIFIDNKFENYFKQISVFFESGFLDKANTVLVTKFYTKNYFNVSREASRLGIKTHFYFFYSQIPLLNGKTVFYPFNGQVNCRLILNREACHVFLTHGESNKKASVNRMARLYDYVIVTGDISCDRYLENKVFSESDLRDGRIVKVGTTLSAPCFDDLAPDGSEPCVAYLPTWEGGNEEENFSSMASPHVAHFLAALCTQLNVSSVIIKPHPNMGGRVAAYQKHLADLVRQLQQSGIKVYMDTATQKWRRIAGKPHAELSVRMGVCDVSASEFMLAAKKIPSILLVNGSKQIFATKKYMELRKNLIININDLSDVERFFSKPLSIRDFTFFAEALYKYSFSENSKQQFII